MHTYFRWSTRSTKAHDRGPRNGCRRASAGFRWACRLKHVGPVVDWTPIGGGRSSHACYRTASMLGGPGRRLYGRGGGVVRAILGLRWRPSDADHGGRGRSGSVAGDDGIGGRRRRITNPGGEELAAQLTSWLSGTRISPTLHGGRIAYESLADYGLPGRQDVSGPSICL
jgi:hypothetical protein